MIETDSDKTCHLVWAVYCGSYATNGVDMLQGGAISSLFDVGTAQIGTVFLPILGGAFGTTKSIDVSFLSPGPLNRVVRMDIKLTDTSQMEKGRVSAMAEMRVDGSNLESKPFARCTCVLVDLVRRENWRQANLCQPVHKSRL